MLLQKLFNTFVHSKSFPGNLVNHTRYLSLLTIPSKSNPERRWELFSKLFWFSILVGGWCPRPCISQLSSNFMMTRGFWFCGMFCRNLTKDELCLWKHGPTFPPSIKPAKSVPAKACPVVPAADLFLSQSVSGCVPLQRACKLHRNLLLTLPSVLWPSRVHLCDW